MICICELLEDESMTLMRDFDGPYDGAFTPWLVGPSEPLHRDLVRHDSRCPMFERTKWAGYIVWHPGDGSEPQKLIAIGEEVIDAYHEREAIVRWLLARSEALDNDIASLALRTAAEMIRDEVAHHATLQEAQGPDSATPSASADSCAKNGGTDSSPETSG